MIRVVRLGSSRQPDEGPRLGTVRRPPRGVRKTDYARRDFYDVWVPDLAPSPTLFAWARARMPFTDAAWRTYARRYAAEMRRPEAQRVLKLLAALSAHTNFSVGCYCEDETRCHRSLLRTLLTEAGGDVARIENPHFRRSRRGRALMPFKSKAQRRKFAELLVKGKIKPETYEEWNRETGGKKLPERVKPKAKAKRKARKKTTARRRSRA